MPMALNGGKRFKDLLGRGVDSNPMKNIWHALPFLAWDPTDFDGRPCAFVATHMSRRFAWEGRYRGRYPCGADTREQRWLGRGKSRSGMASGS